MSRLLNRYDDLTEEVMPILSALVILLYFFCPINTPWRIIGWNIPLIFSVMYLITNYRNIWLSRLLSLMSFISLLFVGYFLFH